MKRIVALFLVFMLVLGGLTACADRKDSPESEPSAPASESTIAEVTPPSSEATDKNTNGDIEYVGQYKIPVRISDDLARDELKIGVMFNDMANDFYVATLDAIKERAAERNVKLYVSTSNNNAGEEPGLMENYLNMGVDGVITVFYAGEGSADVMKRYMEQDIPFVNYIHSVKVCDYQLVSNNTQDGVDYSNAVIDWINTSDWAAEHLANKEKIKIAVGGLTLLESMGDRTRAMIATLEENLPNCEIVATTGDIVSIATAQEWAETAIAQNPDTDLWLGFCDVAALGIYEALLAAGYTGDDCKVFGMDGTPDAFNAMRADNGLFEASLAVDAAQNGQTLVDAVIALCTGLENELIESSGQTAYYAIYWVSRDDLN